MASADDLIRVYERRLAEFEARLAAIEQGARQRPCDNRRERAARRDAPRAATGSASTSAARSPISCCSTKSARAPSPPRFLRRPSDSSIGVLNGIEKICREAGIDPTEIDDVMHGTTVATNTVLTKARRARRPRHDQGLPRRAADRALLCARRPRRLGDLQQAAAARAARIDDRGRGAHRRQWRGADSARRSAHCAAISPTSHARASRR